MSNNNTECDLRHQAYHDGIDQYRIDQPIPQQPVYCSRPSKWTYDTFDAYTKRALYPVLVYIGLGEAAPVPVDIELNAYECPLIARSLHVQRLPVLAWLFRGTILSLTCDMRAAQDFSKSLRQRRGQYFQS